MTDKKNILYLAREMFHNSSISEGLSEKYDVECYLCETIVELPDVLYRPIGTRAYDGVITCVPRNLLTFSYDESLKFLEKAKREHPKIPIIAYTAASPIDMEIFSACRGIDAVVENRGALFRQRDAEEIKKILDKLLK